MITHMHWMMAQVDVPATYSFGRSLCLTLTVACLLLTAVGVLVAAHEDDVRVPDLARVSKLAIRRNFIPKDLAQVLYDELLKSSLPSPQDRFDKMLIGLTGDGGIHNDENLSKGERAKKFHELLGKTNYSQEDRQSGIIRFERLLDRPRNRTEWLIQSVLQNNVLEDGGTIHLYLSLQSH